MEDERLICKVRPEEGVMKKLCLRLFTVSVVLCGFSLWVCNLEAADLDDKVRVLVAYHSMTGNTEKMARAVVEGARSVKGTSVEMQRVSHVTAQQLFASDALVVGSPVYWSNMAGEVKTFFDKWQFQFGVFPEFKMRNKVGAAFATGGQISSGKEVTMLTILAAMLGNQMIVVGGGGAFGASATTEGNSPGIDIEGGPCAGSSSRRGGVDGQTWFDGVSSG